MSVRVSTAFEAGSINVIDSSDPDNVVVELADDNAQAVRQWFYFRVDGLPGRPFRVTFRDIHRSNTTAGMAGMPCLWEGYRAFASVDAEDWFRADTQFDGRHMVVTIRIPAKSVYLANFPPYTTRRHAALLARASRSPRVSHAILGKTPDGLNLDCLTIGRPGAGRKVCWVLARQHPAETQGSWCAAGLIDRLLSPGDPVVTALLDAAVFYVVPLMNPDGARRGNTRTNALGVNLNRTWTNPSAESSPETYWVRKMMEDTGLHFGLDIHGWVGPHNFACGPFNTPSITPRQTELWKRYETALATASEDFEAGWPYPGGGPAPGKADLSMSWNYFSETFGAIGILYELLYKENAARPGLDGGWSAQSCRKFGQATLDAIAAIVHEL